MIIYQTDELDDDGYELNDAIIDENHLWSLDSTTGTVPIPFMIEHGMRPETRDKIAKAISEYDLKTCIR